MILLIVSSLPLEDASSQLLTTYFMMCFVYFFNPSYQHFSVAFVLFVCLAIDAFSK